MKHCKIFFIVVLIILNFSLAQNQQPDRYDVNTVDSNVEVNEGITGSTVPVFINSPYVLLAGERYELNVDETGEAHLEGKKANSTVCDMFLFRQTSVRGGSVPGISSIERGGSSPKQVILDGTVAYKNCKGQTTLTGNAVIIELGTWYTVSYHPKIDVTLIVVLEGSVKVATLQDHERNRYTKINSGEIWISQSERETKLEDPPGSPYYIGSSIGSVVAKADGQTLDISALADTVFNLKELCLDYPFERVNYWASASNIYSFPLEKVREDYDKARPDITDSDNDGIDNCEEIEMGTNPLDYGSDGPYQRGTWEPPTDERPTDERPTDKTPTCPPGKICGY